MKMKKMIKKILSNKKTVNRLLIVLGVFISLALGILTGVFITYQKGLPKIKNLEELSQPVISEVYSNDEKIIGRYYLEKRIILSSEEIPEIVKHAFIAVEDSRFYKHWGVDFLRIPGALFRDIKRGELAQGASTITMQLARSLFLTLEKTWKRKIKETLLALQIEREYTKEQILTYYLNQIYLGHGNIYGIEAASEFFFGKKAKELTLNEAALLAGIHASVRKYSPLIHPKRALSRRNYALKRMYEEGYISEKKYLKNKKKELKIEKQNLYKSDDYIAYFKEEVRKFIASNFGEKYLYQSGLKVYTTLDIDSQKAAYKAVVKGLREHDKRKGWRNDKKNILNKENKLEKFESDDWKNPPMKDMIIDGVVLEVTRKKATIKVDDYSGVLELKNAAWTKKNSLNSLIKRGDIIKVKVLETDFKNKKLNLKLEQEPLTEGAFLAIDPHTGEIKAMIGGYSYERSQFNCAVQATRQPGSTFKPIIYATALSNGYTPSSSFIDEPVTFNNRWTEGDWSPLNFDEKYVGLCTLRRGIEESRNVITAKLLEAITPELAIQFAKKFGVKSPLYPYLSLSLGTFEVTLLEMVSAFSVFPNQGVRVEPFFIKRIVDMNNNVLYESKYEANRVISSQVAYQVTSLLQGVVKRGTAVRVRKEIERNCAGKTGTTDDYTDAWYIGFTPSLVAGVWVGYDHKKSLGYYETGSRTASPIWIHFAKNAFKDEPDEEFDVPSNLNFVNVDYYTGLLATPFCKLVINEVFVPGTEPQRFCSEEEHLLVNDYYPDEDY